MGEDDTGPCYITLALETAKHLKTKDKHLVLSVFKNHIPSLITSSGKVRVPVVAYTVSVSNRFFLYGYGFYLAACYLVKSTCVIFMLL